MRILAVITLSLSVFLMACDKQEEAPASVAEPAAAAPTVEQAPAAPASSQVPAITDAGVLKQPRRHRKPQWSKPKSLWRKPRLL